METLSNVIAAILGFFVTVIGSAIVGGALVFLFLVVALNAYEWAVKGWAKLKRACDPAPWVDDI